MAGLLGPSLQVRLVDLDDVCAGCHEVVELLVHRLGVHERQGTPIRVVVVLRLLAHREGPGTMMRVGYWLMVQRSSFVIEPQSKVPGPRLLRTVLL